MNPRLALAAACAAALNSLVLATDVSGNQSGTWSFANSPYNLVGDVVVPAGQTLVIEPGVVVMAQGYYKLTVTGGTLHAVGSAAQPILMSCVNHSTGWRGVKLDTAGSGSELRYCTIEYARAPTPYPDVRGGGLYILNCSPTVSYCEFRFNYSHNSNANGAGGGILTETSGAQLSHNYIHDNQADSGAGICITEYGTPHVADNLITNNTASYAGGGMYFGARSSPLVERNTILRNTSGYWGGGGINSWTSFIFYNTYPVIRDNIIAGNTATSGSSAQGGGGIYCRYDRAEIFNNTVYANNSPQGGGIFVVCYPEQAPIVRSSIVYANTSPNGAQIGLEGSVGAQIDVAYSDVQGGWTGAGNIDLPPQLVNPAADDYHLAVGSPCIDTGDPGFVPAACEQDIDGQLRLWHGLRAPPNVDMGADEFGAHRAGDLNCDGQIDFDDINPFVLALSDPSGYAAAYPGCWIEVGDVNCDGRVSFEDINPFVALLTGS